MAVIQYSVLGGGGKWGRGWWRGYCVVVAWGYGERGTGMGKHFAFKSDIPRRSGRTTLYMDYTQLQQDSDRETDGMKCARVVRDEERGYERETDKLY